jgi:hypothetical protein
MEHDFKHMTADQTFNALKLDTVDHNPSALQEELHHILNAHGRNDTKFWQEMKHDLNVSQTPYKGLVNFSGMDIEVDAKGNLLGMEIKSITTGKDLAKVVPGDEAQFNKQHKQFEDHLAKAQHQHQDSASPENILHDPVPVKTTDDQRVNQCLQDIHNPDQLTRDLTDLQTGDVKGELKKLVEIANANGIKMSLEKDPGVDGIIWTDGGKEHEIVVPNYAYPAYLKR